MPKRRNNNSFTSFLGAESDDVTSRSSEFSAENLDNSRHFSERPQLMEGPGARCLSIDDAQVEPVWKEQRNVLRMSEGPFCTLILIFNTFVNYIKIY